MTTQRSSVIVFPRPGTPTAISAFNSCPSSPLSRTFSPTPRSEAVQYRIEERRRTIFVTSDSPPTVEEVNTIFQLAEIPDSESPSSTTVTADGEIYVVEGPTISTALGNPPGHPNTHTTMHSSRSAVTLRVANNTNTPPNSPTYRSPRTPVRRRILFYHKNAPHYGFTNFSPHPVMYHGQRYPTSEHLFQSFKFQGHRPSLAEHIRTCSEWPSVAFKEARRFQPEVRSDWKLVNIEKMDETLWHKFTQHRDLREELLATGDAELVEDSDKDAFWGVGADGLGRNELGKALERLRAQFRKQ